MKTIHIGDIHGRSFWKHIVSANPDADKIVFHGDYFDDYETTTTRSQIENFEEIVELRKKEPDRIILLTGNHDLHYIPVVGETYSGYQTTGAIDIWISMSERLKYMQMCYITKHFICSHAGITKTFLERVGIENDKDLEKNLNELLEFRPKKFGFYGIDLYGDDITQGPVWVRPNSLLADGIPKLHIVGHSKCPRIELLKGNCNVYKIDTSGYEYLECNNGQFLIRKI